MTKQSAFGLAAQIQDLAKICLVAEENKSTQHRITGKGFEGALALIESLTGSLAEMIEDLEANQKSESELQEPVPSVSAIDAPDPIVTLYQRWSEMRAAERIYMKDCPTGDWDAPDMIELDAKLTEVEHALIRMTPSSSAGVAALVDFHWHMFVAEALEGTEAWSQALERPEVKLMRHIRHGAHLVAA